MFEGGYRDLGFRVLKGFGEKGLVLELQGLAF